MPALPFLIPLAFAAWWCFIMWVVSRLCGWHALARHYRAENRFHGKHRRFSSVKVGSGNYSGCVTLGANSDGLSLAVMVLFRVGHPPLFIPWADLKPRIKKMWIFGEWLEFEVKRTPHVKLSFAMAVAKKLAADANHAWDATGLEVR
jgi:hypothetical protein